MKPNQPTKQIKLYFSVELHHQKSIDVFFFVEHVIVQSSLHNREIKYSIMVINIVTVERP